MCTPVILFNLIMGFIFAFQEFTVPWMLTQGGPMKSTELYAINLYRNGFIQLSMGKASAMAWILFVIIMVFSTSCSARRRAGCTTEVTNDHCQPVSLRQPECIVQASQIEAACRTAQAQSANVRCAKACDLRRTAGPGLHLGLPALLDGQFGAED